MAARTVLKLIRYDWKVENLPLFWIRNLSSPATLKSSFGPPAPGGTVNQSEASKFDYGVAGWWESGGVAQPLQAMNALRVPLVKNSLLGTSPGDITTLDHTPYPLHGYCVLDAGCGAGLLCEPLARLGAEVTGIDPSEANITTASGHASHDPEIRERLDYHCCSVEEFATNGRGSGEGGGRRGFDAVVASEVVEHVADLPAFVEEICTLVKPGGLAIFTTINRTVISHVAAILLAEYLLRLVPRGSHQWNKFVTPGELTELLRATSSEMKVTFCHGMGYNPLTNRWTWIGDTSVNYALVATRLQAGMEPGPETSSPCTDDIRST